MYMSEKGKLILKLLLDSKEAISMDKIADKLSMSPRSVRTYMKEVGDTLHDLGCILVNKTGVGVYIEVGEEKRKEICSKLSFEECFSSNPVLRQNYIIGTLLKNRYSYTIQLLADDLYVGKGTIIKDIEEVEKWFLKHKLSLVKKPNYGLSVEGNEFDIRNALGYYNEYILKHNESSMETEKSFELDYRIDEGNYKKLRGMYPRIDIIKISEILTKAECMLGTSYTAEAFINLISQISIVVERVKNGKEFKIDEKELCLLTDKLEYGAALWIIEQLGKDFNMHIPEAEAGYITIYMLGAGTQQDAEDYDSMYELLDEEYKDFAIEIVQLVSGILGVSLKNDTTLQKGLSLHLKRAVTRLKYDMFLKNPLLEEIKKEYTSIFGACWATSCIFERRTGVLLNEDEVAFIAIHIGGAVSRRRRQIIAVVICASGIGTSQLIAGKIERQIPEITIKDVLPYSKLNEDILEKADIIISTVSVQLKKENLIFISTMVSELDIKRIREAAAKTSGFDTEVKDSRPLPNIILNELIVINGGFKTKEEVILHGSGLLFEKGYVTSEFAKDVLRREQITSTAVGKGAAIPHGIQGYVIRPGICIIKLKRPIDWSGEKVDLIFVLALKFSDIKETKDFFKYFYTMLNDETILQSIRASSEPESIVNIIVR